MPDSTRGLLIKKADSALWHLDEVEAIFAYMHSKYYPDYPDYYPIIEMCGLGLNELIAAMRQLREVM